MKASPLGLLVSATLDEFISINIYLVPRPTIMDFLKRLFLAIIFVVLRLFLARSDLSVENSLFQLKPKSGFLTQSKGNFLRSRIFQSKTAFFDSSPNRAFLHSRKRALSTQLFLTEFSDWGIQSKRSSFSTGWCQSKNSVEKVLHVLFYPIASLVPPPNTHPHAHAPIPGTT